MAEERVTSKWNKPWLTAPILMLFIFAAMHLSRFLLSKAKSEDLMLSISLIQILVLALPCMLYYLFRGRKFATPMPVSPIRFRHLGLILFAAASYVTGSLLIKFFFLRMNLKTVNVAGFFDSLSGQIEEPSFAGILLSFVLVPAICEELLFRGVLLAEYRSLGGMNAVLMTSFCFAMLHFSLTGFPAYFFAGVLFGTVTLVSRSVIPAVLLHILANALNVFASDQFLRITQIKNGPFFVGFLLTVLFAASLFFFLYCVEHLYYRFSEEPPETTLPPRNRDGVSRTFLSPTFLLLTVAFLLVTALQATL